MRGRPQPLPWQKERGAIFIERITGGFVSPGAVEGGSRTTTVPVMNE
jgi:hypothetical protein